MVVWAKSIIPIVKGCNNRVNMKEDIIITGDIAIIRLITESSLIKILALGVRDKKIILLSDVLRQILFPFLIYKTSVFSKLLKLMSILGFYYLIPLVRVARGLWVFVSKRKHLLNTLLSLEYIMLRIFWFICVHLSLLAHESYFVLFFLTLAACEGALGLALLVSIVRTHGNDCFSRFSVLQC